jgi:hypothetical protein
MAAGQLVFEPRQGVFQRFYGLAPVIACELVRITRPNATLRFRGAATASRSSVTLWRESDFPKYLTPIAPASLDVNQRRLRFPGAGAILKADLQPPEIDFLLP